MRYRLRWVIAAGCLLIAALIWLLRPGADNDLHMREAHDAASGGSASPLTVNDQTPPALKPLMDDDNEDAETEPTAPVLAPSTGKYQFTKWQDAMDEYARLVGIEYEKLVAEGHPQPVVWASMNVDARLFKNGENPELSDALHRFMPIGNLDEFSPEQRSQIPNIDNRIPDKIWRNPIWILVWAGKLPEGRQYGRLRLPNGEMLYLEEYQQARVSWKVRRPPAAQTEAGKLELEALRQRETQLASSIQKAQDAEFDKLFIQLEQVQNRIHQIESPSITNHYMESGASNEAADHPEFEIIEKDLGVIDAARNDD